MSRAATIGGRLLRVPGAWRPAPSVVGIPGLPSKPWWERDDPLFAAWLPRLEAAAPDIRAEWDRLRGRPSDYRISDSEHAGTLHSSPEEWHWATFVDGGRVVPALWEECPATAAALEGVPGLMVGDMPYAFAFFSTLRPGSRIAPHTAPANLRLRFHLCLQAAPAASGPEAETSRPACGMRVADEVREWEEGRCLVFDDAYEHEVWNDSAGERAVLLFDIWHPLLSPDEVHAIRQMFARVQGMADARRGGAAAED